MPWTDEEERARLESRGAARSHDPVPAPVESHFVLRIGPVQVIAMPGLAIPCRPVKVPDILAFGRTDNERRETTMGIVSWLRPASGRPCPVSAVFLAVTVLLFAAASPASAESADEANLRNIAGASVIYTAQVRELLAHGTDSERPGFLRPDSRSCRVGHWRGRNPGGPARGRWRSARPGPGWQHTAASGSGCIFTDLVGRQFCRRNPGAAAVPGRIRTQPTREAKARSTSLHAVMTLQQASRSCLVPERDPNRTNARGDTPLHAALGPNRGVTSVVGALLHRGADPAAVNSAGLTPLMMFLRYGPDNGATVAVLLLAGADPDARNPEGETPLHSAIRTGGSLGKVEVVEALLAGNADPCMRDAEGYTPYQIAIEDGTIHQALDRAGGHDLACGGDEDQAAALAIAEADRMMRAVETVEPAQRSRNRLRRSRNSRDR